MNFILKLFIAGKASRNEHVIKNLRRICEMGQDDNYELVIIDIFEKPQLAKNYKILVTPTLVKELAPPYQRITGDLSNSEKVLKELEIRLPNDPEALHF